MNILKTLEISFRFLCIIALVSICVFIEKTVGEEIDNTLIIPRTEVSPDDIIMHMPNASILCWLPVEVKVQNTVICYFVPNSGTAGVHSLDDLLERKELKNKEEIKL